VSSAALQVQTRFTGPTTHLVFEAGKKAHFDKATEGNVPAVTPEWVTQYVIPSSTRKSRPFSFISF
jgi:hypothetical protein